MLPTGHYDFEWSGGTFDVELRAGGVFWSAQFPAAARWSYDAATLVFRHAANSRVCIDYFVQHNTFGAWTCRDELEVNAQQSFRYDEGRDRFCLLSDPRRCVQEATSDLLY